jgi:GT2 family glycosyltransferase
MIPLVSVISGTVNRLYYLKKMVWSLRAGGVGNLDYEIVLVDGGSTDGTIPWSLLQPDVVFIQQSKKLGAIKAFNAGFAKARGEFVVNLNDDVEVTPDVIPAAIDILHRSSETGQVALPFADPWHKVHLDYFPPIDGKGPRLLYANFGVTRKWLGDKLGWWGDYNYTYAGDTHLSTAIWNAGYTVAALDAQHFVWHEIVQDETRIENTETAKWREHWRTRWQGIPAAPRIREGE